MHLIGFLSLCIHLSFQAIYQPINSLDTLGNECVDDLAREQLVAYQLAGCEHGCRRPHCRYLPIACM